MKVSDFRKHQILRTCKDQYDDYHHYKAALSQDFQQRCGYCNMNENTIAPLSFQIDHFVPIKVFKGKRDELKTRYDNLVWACPKCNRAKSAQHDGDIYAQPAENSLFYKPDLTDYNKVFYRNEVGGIASDDKKGQEMIRNLKLFRPIHNYAWVYELLDETIAKLSSEPEDDNGDKNKLLLKLYRERDRIRKLLCMAYK